MPILGLSASSSTKSYGLTSKVYGGTAGYVAGGQFSGGSGSDNVDKFFFSTDNKSVFSLQDAQYEGGSCSSSTAGYICGGTRSGNYTNQIQKIRYSDDATSILSSGLSSARAAIAGFSSLVSGYLAGGNPGSIVSTVDKLIFSSETRTTSATGLSAVRDLAGGFSSNSYGYVAGGRGSGPTFINLVEKFLFSNDTRSAVASSLSTARWPGFCVASTSAGYVIGGFSSTDPSTFIYISSIEKYTFSDDARSTISASLSTARGFGSGFASSQAGYCAGGNNLGSHLNLVEKLLFSNETISTIGSVITTRNKTYGLSVPLF